MASLSFKRGEVVEVCSNQQGYEGSYYKARIISTLGGKTCTVEYDTLLNEGESEPLIEVVPINEIRPLPPKVNSVFMLGDKVDVYDNDGYWIGYIIGKKDDMFLVYFDIYDVEAFYSSNKLRFHLDWVKGEWVELL